MALLARNLAPVAHLRPSSSEQFVLLSEQRNDLIVLLPKPGQDRHDELRRGVRWHPIYHAFHDPSAAARRQKPPGGDDAADYGSSRE